jgi:hypothetical protein
MENTKTKSLEGVRVPATCRVSAYGQTKGVRTKPTRCVVVLDSIAGLKDHYRLKGQTFLGKGEKVDLSLKMGWCEGYGYRVIDWKYI